MFLLKNFKYSQKNLFTTKIIKKYRVRIYIIPVRPPRPWCCLGACPLSPVWRWRRSSQRRTGWRSPRHCSPPPKYQIIKNNLSNSNFKSKNTGFLFLSRIHLMSCVESTWRNAIDLKMSTMWKLIVSQDIFREPVWLLASPPSAVFGRPSWRSSPPGDRIIEYYCCMASA